MSSACTLCVQLCLFRSPCYNVPTKVYQKYTAEGRADSERQDHEATGSAVFDDDEGCELPD
jgi:hypothetical protein